MCGILPQKGVKQEHTPFAVKYGYTESGHIMHITNLDNNHCLSFYDLLIFVTFTYLSVTSFNGAAFEELSLVFNIVVIDILR